MPAESIIEKLTAYFADQRLFLADPRAFVEQRRPALANSLQQPVRYLLGAGAGVLAAGQVNLNLYDERITRAVSLPDLITGQASALASAATLALAIYGAMRLIGSRITVRESVGSTFYAIAFVLPALAAVFIVSTRTASFLGNVPILFLPPTRVVPLGTPENTWPGAIAMALLVTVQLGWNLYMTWLLWVTMRTLAGLSAVRVGIAVAATVATVYAISGVENAAVGSAITILKPALEKLL